MSEILGAFSIQSWLESCPQGYLLGTVYGHPSDSNETPLVLDNEVLREDAIRVTVQLIAGERCALAASSGLINAAPDEPSKLFLATQTLDEGRHVEIFTRRLLDLGVAKEDVQATVERHVNPNLVRFAEVLLEKVDKKDFVAGVVGQNLILEGMAFTVFEMLHAANAALNPKFAATLSGTIADERRHVGFGESRIGALIKEHPERRADVERMQKEMSYHMLATFADAFRQARPALLAAREVTKDAVQGATTWQGVDLKHAPVEELEAALASTVLREFKTRLGRVGIQYQTPEGP